jgi:hypothetical protein
MIPSRTIPSIPPAESPTPHVRSHQVPALALRESPKKIYSGHEDTKCVADSPPLSPAVLFSTVVLVTRRVLSHWTCMPPPAVAAVLPTTLDFSMLIPTPNSP